VTDLDHMRRAIALAAAQLGRTAPNPSVGCVIVNHDGVVVGEGATGDGGRPHAEEIALAQAGDQAEGGVAYVTLEPCGERSSGSPSCSSLLIEKRISRVVVASADASHYASGRGPGALETAGVTLETGLLADEAEVLYADYHPHSENPLETRN